MVPLSVQLIAQSTKKILYVQSWLAGPLHLIEPLLDPLQAGDHLVVVAAAQALAGALDERGGDRRGDDGEEADPADHDQRADQLPLGRARHVVAVADRRHRLHRPPEPAADRRELVVVEQPDRQPAAEREQDRRARDPLRGAAHRDRPAEQPLAAKPFHAPILRRSGGPAHRPRRVMRGHPGGPHSGFMSRFSHAVRSPEPIEEKGTPAYLAEFLGTLVLVLAITGLVSASAVTGLSLTNLALVHALALMGIVYSIGTISGAHVNPAVTLALLTIRKISGRDAGMYIVMQALGGVAGAFLAKAFFLGRGALVNYGAPGISDRYLQGGSVGLAFLAEAIGEFLIVWAVMGTAVNPTAPKGAAGAAIGGALALGVLIFGPATGASFNPARWFGPALASGTWTDAWLYILAPIAGGIAAALSYRAIMEMSSIPAQTARRGESVGQA